MYGLRWLVIDDVEGGLASMMMQMGWMMLMKGVMKTVLMMMLELQMVRLMTNMQVVMLLMNMHKMKLSMYMWALILMRLMLLTNIRVLMLMMKRKLHTTLWRFSSCYCALYRYSSCCHCTWIALSLHTMFPPLRHNLWLHNAPV